MNRLVRNYKLSIDFSFVNFTILPSKQFQFERTRITLRQCETSFYPATIFWQSILRIAKSMYAFPHRYETDINIRYLSRNSSSRLIFQAQRNYCHCYLGQIRCYPVVHSIHRSIIRIQRIARLPDRWSIDACSWRHASVSFSTTLQKTRHSYDFGESHEKRGTNNTVRWVFEESSHGSWSTIHTRVKVKERTIVAGCHRIVNRFVIASIVKFRLGGLTQWELSFRNDLVAFLACLWCDMRSFFEYKMLRCIGVYRVWQEVKAWEQCSEKYIRENIWRLSNRCFIV